VIALHGGRQTKQRRILFVLFQPTNLSLDASQQVVGERADREWRSGFGLCLLGWPEYHFVSCVIAASEDSAGAQTEVQLAQAQDAGKLGPLHPRERREPCAQV